MIYLSLKAPPANAIALGLSLQHTDLEETFQSTESTTLKPFPLQFPARLWQFLLRAEPYILIIFMIMPQSDILLETTPSYEALSPPSTDPS